MFWIICAVLILIAFVFIYPSFRKLNISQDASSQQNILIAKEQLAELESRFESGEIDQESYQSTRDELEQSLYADLDGTQENSTSAEKSGDSRSSLVGALLIFLLIPAIAIPFYYKTGNLNFIGNVDAAKSVEVARDKKIPKNPDGTPDIDTMVAGLQKKLDDNPDNPKGWFMLARSYMVLKRYPEAVKAYEQTYKLMPESATVMISLADSLAMMQQGKMTGRPATLVEKALTIEPQNATGLWLSGMAAREQLQYQTAITQWNKAIPLLQDSPAQVTELRNLIADARSKLPEGAQTAVEQANLVPAPAVAAASNPTAGVSQAEVKVTVSLSEAFKNKVSPTDLVFIYAKAMSGPPMPLAAVRKQVQDLPLEVTLSDEMAMIPNLKLSSFETVIVGARVSKSGQAISQNGDLYTEKHFVKRGDQVVLEINQVLVK